MVVAWAVVAMVACGVLCVVSPLAFYLAAENWALRAALMAKVVGEVHGAEVDLVAMAVEREEG